MNRRL